MTHHRKGSKRLARRASIERKRNAFYTWKTPPNKKPLARAKGYDLMQSDALPSAPAAEPITPATGAIGNEICN